MEDERQRSPTPPLDPYIRGLQTVNRRLRQENVGLRQENDGLRQENELLEQFEWEANEENKKLNAQILMLRKLVETQGQALNEANAALPTDRSLDNFRNLQEEVRKVKLELANA